MQPNALHYKKRLIIAEHIIKHSLQFLNSILQHY